jgi:hypothetical protein
MLRGRAFAALALVVGAVLCTSLQLPAASRGGSRDLEKVFKNSGFSDSAASQIERAFKVAIDAGVDNREALALVGFGVEGDLSAEQVVTFWRWPLSTTENLQTEMFLSKIREGVGGWSPAGSYRPRSFAR